MYGNALTLSGKLILYKNRIYVNILPSPYLFQPHFSNIPAGRISTGKELYIAPWWVGIDYAVFLHRLNISRTSRSAPLTSPVSTSILKPNCPKYCHAIVTAGSVVSTDGASLDRKAE